MTETTRARLPAHLKRYLAEQNYQRYTAEDQAAWRYVMRQLKNFLSQHAHPSYLDGFKKSGLQIDRIPHIDVVDEHLERFGWGAVPVSGFIPPAAFMEFQALGILPIACDMRTIDHLLYTPAPDIVHEAAGHAPILVNPEYGAYLRQYGEIARHSIISKHDLAQYEAIRVLSDLKEDPTSTPATIQRAEQHLNKVTAAITFTSEAALLSRMNWWTAEYGLIGNPSHPRIFGAGLLSSVGEARSCLESTVKKIPLSVDCVNYAYDITEPQPQLFVATEFAHLGQVLDELADRLAYRRGGVYGLEQAKASQTVNTIQLNSGLQMTGVLKDFRVGDKPMDYLILSGPCQLACGGHELPEQGTAQHPQGFSSPVGFLQGQSQCLSTFSDAELGRLGVHRGQSATLQFQSGVIVKGRVQDWVRQKNQLLVIRWTDCRVTHFDRLLFDPAWGTYDMAVGSSVTSVFAGPADRVHYGEVEDFANKRVAARNFSGPQLKRHSFYQRVRDVRDKGVQSVVQWQSLRDEYLRDPEAEWLLGIELLELALALKYSDDADVLRQHLQMQRFNSVNVRMCVRDGLALAAAQL